MAKYFTTTIAATILIITALARGISDDEKKEFCAFSETWGCTEDCTKICEEKSVCGGSCVDGKIVALNISDKQLKEIDSSIQNMKYLQNITLKNNQIADLPNSLGSITGLIELDVSGNLLTGLPKSIDDLKSLKILNLHNNRAYMLKSLGSLTSLERLDLGSNSLKTLPKSMKGLETLTYLDLSRNDLDCFQLKGWPEVIRSACDQKEQRDKFGRTKTGLVLSAAISVCIVITIVVIIILNVFCMKKDPEEYKAIN